MPIPLPLLGRARRLSLLTAAGLAAAALMLALWTLLAPRAEAACANEALRAAQSSAALPAGSAYLPDCMALEMVSPPKKFGQTAKEPTFSPGASRVQFRSAAGLADTPGLQFVLDSYVATRSAAGWAVAPTSPPTSAQITAGTKAKGGPYTFNAALDRWLLLGATKAQSEVGIGRIYAGGLDGSFAPLSPLLEPINDSGTDRIVVDIGESESTGSSQDLSTTVFYPKLHTTSYLPGDPRLEPGGDRNNYLAFEDVAGQPALQLLARDGEGNVYGGRCGSHLGGGVAEAGSEGRLNQGAISADGTRIYFTTRPGQSKEDEEEGSEGQCDTGAHPLRIFKRQSGPFGADPAIAEIAPGAGVDEPGDDLYQGASADGTKLFFTTTRQLTAADKDFGASCSATIGASAGCDLYLYDATRPEGERLTDVSAGGPSPGEGAEVLKNVAAISGDGSRAYFAATGVLSTDPNPEGDVARPPAVGEGVLSAARGQGDLSTGSTTVSALLAAAGKGDLSAGSTTVESLSVALGEFLAGQPISGEGIPPGATIEAVGAGQLTLSAPVEAGKSGEGVELTSQGPAPFAVGQTIFGEGIPPATTIVSVAPGQLELSAPAEASGAAVALDAGSALVTGLSVSEGAFHPGMAISGPGIPANTTIQSVAPGELTLSALATANGAQPLSAANLNLYLHQRDAEFPSGRTAFLGALHPRDAGGLWGSERSFGGDAYSVPLLGAGPEAGGDGHVLFFASRAPLTADDADGAADVFRYDSEAETLQRISRAAPGGSEAPPADATVGGEGAGPNANFAEFGRWASEDGITAIFSSAEPLEPGDGDEAANPYLWKAGPDRVYRLPGSPEGPTVSLDGGSAGFSTAYPLLPSDGDTASDVYVARADGGFAIAAAPQACAGEACQLAAPPPPALLPASNSFVGPGNAKPKRSTRACARQARRALGLARRAKRLRRAARRAGPAARRKRAHAARRSAKTAKRLSRSARRCRARARRAGG